jgi:acetolactate synthase I/II/III large subunit
MDSTAPTAAEALVAALLRNGLTRLFTLPGVQNDHFHDALHGARDRIAVIHTRHEQGAGYMALGAAMATGEPAACCVVPGPGVLNAGAALATGWAVGAPLLCLTGQLPGAAIGKQYGLLHEIADQPGLLAGLTKWSARIDTAEQAGALTDLAFRQLRTGRPRPVALETPLDIWPARALQAATEGPQPPAPLDEAAITRAADWLAHATCPAILVGGGAQSCAEDVRALAERLQAPVISYRLGRGVLDSDHTLALNAYEGHLLWSRVDVVIAIGTRMQTAIQVWGADPGLRVIHVEIDPEEMARIHTPDLAIEADAARVLPALLAALPALARPPADFSALRAQSDTENAHLAPQRAWLDAIRAALPEDGTAVFDITQLGHVARIFWPVRRPRSFLDAGYQGTLGWAFAAGLGAQVARPDAATVAICGDGGFLFTMPELATAAQFAIPLVTIVMNDNAYGNVRRTQTEEFGNRTIASDLRNPDFAALAASFGIAAHRARDPGELTRVLRAALERRAPALIEVQVGQMPNPWRTLRFARMRGL